MNIGTGWDELPATITLAYKSGQTHIHQTSVGDARKRSEAATRRKSVKWIRVSIPNHDSTREIRCFYSPSKQWTRSIVILPRTKD